MACEFYLEILVNVKKKLIILFLASVLFFCSISVFAQETSSKGISNVPIPSKISPPQTTDANVLEKKALDEEKSVGSSSDSVADTNVKNTPPPSSEKGPFFERIEVWLAILAFLGIPSVSGISYSIYRIVRRFKEDMELARSAVDTSLSNLIFSADTALMHLPDMTSYTQQIPPKVVQDLKIFSRIFSSKTDEGKKLWEKLNRGENGARICVAKALYLLGKEACDKRFIISTGDQSEEDTESENSDEKRGKDYESVIGLLKNASKSVDEDDVLLRANIYIRMVQAFRQIGKYDAAKSTLKELQGFDRGGTNPVAKILGLWGEAVLNLQLGMFMNIRFEENVIISRTLKENLRMRRRGCFSDAVILMDNIYENVFGWKFNDTWGNPRYYRFQDDGNLAYYTAKAFWMHRFTYDKDSLNYQSEPIESYDEKFKDALYAALLMFNKRRSGCIEDPCIAAIYNYCVALILTIRETFASVNGADIAIEPGNDETAKADFGRHAGNPDYWRRLRNECIRISESKLKEIQHLGFPIYIENTECLNRTNIFQEGIDMLRKIVESRDEDKYNLFSDFYSFGKIP